MLNLLIGLPTMMACLVLQAASTFWSVRFYTQQSGRMRPGRGLIANVRTLLIVMIIMMLGNFPAFLTPPFPRSSPCGPPASPPLSRPAARVQPQESRAPPCSGAL